MGAANVFLWWAVPTFRITLHECLGWVALLVAAAGPAGGSWMFYNCFRYEKKFWRRLPWAAIAYFLSGTISSALADEALPNALPYAAYVRRCPIRPPIQRCLPRRRPSLAR